MIAPSLRLRSPTTAILSQVRRASDRRPQTHALQQSRWFAQRSHEPRVGTTTPVPDDKHPPKAKTQPPFYFEAGYALFAKRPSRPFPPPFLSKPSTSFSEPLSTHNQSRDRRPKVNGEMIRGVTNGDDAVLVGDYFIGANDGVGAWGTREKGHAACVYSQSLDRPSSDRSQVCGPASSSTSGPSKPRTHLTPPPQSPTRYPTFSPHTNSRSRQLPSPTSGMAPQRHAVPCSVPTRRRQTIPSST